MQKQNKMSLLPSTEQPKLPKKARNKRVRETKQNKNKRECTEIFNHGSFTIYNNTSVLFLSSPLSLSLSPEYQSQGSERVKHLLKGLLLKDHKISDMTATTKVEETEI
ncbi:unnamed protein product [Ilex paraguariensis]|uniref:Uncharacterized protein n=1 Tax=Ilex paraguariensis TaxID=185542 RepID=A0ABC8U8H8_9AQUA